MRDIIWTLIVVWLIYKIVGVFKSTSSKKSFTNTDQQTHSTAHQTVPEKDIKNAIKKHLNNEGEYVDFEEVK
jgi:hypothetical protein